MKLFLGDFSLFLFRFYIDFFSSFKFLLFQNLSHWFMKIKRQLSIYISFHNEKSSLFILLNNVNKLHFPSKNKQLALSFFWFKILRFLLFASNFYYLFFIFEDFLYLAFVLFDFLALLLLLLLFCSPLNFLKVLLLLFFLKERFFFSFVLLRN